jgi:hypothetical protein
MNFLHNSHYVRLHYAVMMVKVLHVHTNIAVIEDRESH